MSQRHPVQNQKVMFITIVTKGRWTYFQDPVITTEAIRTLYAIQQRRPFFLYGFVYMPDHCHLLLSVPEHGSISKIMNVYKRAVSFNVGQNIWQNRFYLTIPKNAWTALDYLHMNPIKAGLCNKIDDYPWSSANGKWDICNLDS